MDFLLGAAGILHGQQTAHQLPDDHRGRLKDLFVVGGRAGDGELGAELVLYGAAHFVA